jgi:hypothetical protein
VLVLLHAGIRYIFLHVVDVNAALPFVLDDHLFQRILYADILK